MPCNAVLRLLGLLRDFGDTLGIIRLRWGLHAVLFFVNPPFPARSAASPFTTPFPGRPILLASFCRCHALYRSFQRCRALLPPDVSVNQQPVRCRVLQPTCADNLNNTLPLVPVLTWDCFFYWISFIGLTPISLTMAMDCFVFSVCMDVLVAETPNSVDFVLGADCYDFVAPPPVAGQLEAVSLPFLPPPPCSQVSLPLLLCLFKYLLMSLTVCLVIPHCRQLRHPPPIYNHSYLFSVCTWCP